MMLSDRVQRIGFSATLRIGAKAAQMLREGVDVIDLSVGEPDFPTPEFIKAAARRAMERNQTKYTHNDGLPELREAIAEKYRRECGADYRADEVIVSTGAKQCLFNLCSACLNPGDEVLIPVPYWVSYPQMVSLAGGVPVFVPTREENGFRMTAAELERALTPKTRAVIINNPANPTGTAYAPEDLTKLLDVALDEGLLIIADEIYERLVYDGFGMRSVASFGDRVRRAAVVISGFSKSYSMTGWRLGYAVGPRELIEGMSKVQSHSTSNPTSIAQWAGLEALRGPQHDIDRMRTEFERRRNLALYRLQQIPHLSCHKPEGAFYLFPNVSWYYDFQYDGVPIRNSAGLAYYLLKSAHVAVVPGESFGDDRFIRLSYATSTEQLERGIVRIAEALGRLKPMAAARRPLLANTVTKVRGFVELEDSVNAATRDALVAEAHRIIAPENSYEWNANVGGIVLRLVTNSPHLSEFWAENWYPASLESDLEPHGALFGVKDAPGREPRAYYSPETRTVLTFNTAFYPQLRALTLGMAEDLAARASELFMVAGACVETAGRGVALIAPPGTGAATHLAGLLRQPEVKLHSYDGFFVRRVGGEFWADSVERKFMVRTDWVKHLPELERLFDRCKLENVVTRRDDCEVEGCGRYGECPLDRGGTHCYLASRRSVAMLDPYWLGGPARHTRRATLVKVILLKRDTTAPKVQKPNSPSALKIIEEGAWTSERRGYHTEPFYNPYQLVRTTDRLDWLRRRWKGLLEAIPLAVVNTGAMSVEEARALIWDEARRD